MTFRNEFDKVNNTGARMLYVLSYGVKITLKSHFCRRNLRFCHYVCYAAVKSMHIKTNKSDMNH